MKPTQDIPAHFAKSCWPDRCTHRLKARILLSEPVLDSKIYYLNGQCKTQSTDWA